MSRDGGNTWKNVVDKVPGVPKETHVSRVEASHFDAGTAYVTFDGHRTDDHKPYVFMTTDFGETWTSISANLPDGNVNVIREDPKNRNLLYLGTEYAFYVSLNGGKEWKRFMNGLPTVRIDDILVHPRDNDLIVGTHGRSIWIIDDITALQQLTDETMTTDATLFDIRPATAWMNDIQKAITVGGAKDFRGAEPGARHGDQLLAEGDAGGDVQITITDVTGREVRSDRRHEERRPESRAVEPGTDHSSRTRRARCRRRWRRCWRRRWRRWRARGSASARPRWQLPGQTHGR